MSIFSGVPNIKFYRKIHYTRGLIQALNYPATYVRRDAAKALGEIRSLGIVKPLVDAFNKSHNNSSTDNTEDKEAIAWALGEIGGPEAVKQLISTLKINSKYYYLLFVHVAAAKALGKIRDTQSVEPLINALKYNDAEDRDKFNSFRSQVAIALGQIKDARAVEPLIASLNNADEFFTVHESVIDALADIGDQRAVKPIVNSLKNKFTSVRRQAANALGKIGNPVENVELLITALKDEDDYVRSSAADALGKIGDPKAITPLYDLVQDGNATNACLSAIMALDKFGAWESNNKDERVIKSLLAALKSKNWHVRDAATERLKKLDWKEEVS